MPGEAAPRTAAAAAGAPQRPCARGRRRRHRGPAGRASAGCGGAPPWLGLHPQQRPAECPRPTRGQRRRLPPTAATEQRQPQPRGQGRRPR
eukprot:15429290-Alexandrium_andersonii.AAC.1